MFCPECRAEYRPGFTKCKDCDVDLVDALEPPELDNPVEIARFMQVHQAEFAVSVLEGSGVKAFLDQSFTGHIAPHYVLTSGGVRLFVRAEDRDRAIEVLNSSSSDGSSVPIDDPE
jgi:hypothetical protein